MKKLLILLVAVLALFSCGTGKSLTNNQTEKDEIARAIADSVSERSFTVDVDYMIPRRVSARYLTSPYDIQIRDNELRSYLPYFGVAYRSDMEDTYRSPLEFTEPIKSIHVKKTKKNSYIITVTVRHKVEQLTYQIEIFDNGNASVDIISTEREPITFTGKMLIR